jgi:hypothetical protein
VSTFRIVEALDVVASSRDRYTLRAVRSVFNDEKKLSIAALSQTLPYRLIEQTLTLLWQEYRTAHPDGYGYTWFCDKFAVHQRRANPVFRHSHAAGAVMQTGVRHG